MIAIYKSCKKDDFSEFILTFVCMGYYTWTTIRETCRYIINSDYKTPYYIECMSIWSRFIGTRKSEETNNVIGNQIHMCHMMPSRYAIVDVEIGLKDHKIKDIGELLHDGAIYHKTSKEEII